MLALGNTMAIVTTTSQCVEVQIIVNGVTISTRYFDNETQAANFIAANNIDEVEFETLSI